MLSVSSRKRAGGWSEERLHAWLARRSGTLPILAGSPMHDAACLRPFHGRPTISSDQTIEGVHFELSTPGRRVGSKAAARSLSDLAATAARPYALALCVAAAPSVSEAYLRALIRGCAEMGRRFRAELVCGDLAQTRGPLVVSVAALGVLAGRRKPPGRDRARAGDVVLLSGPVGGSPLGRHLRIEPRVLLGRALFDAGARALMDVSDGLALDLSRIARASERRIDLDCGRVPIHADARRLARSSGLPPLEHALHDGEDHELLAALPKSVWGREGPGLQRRFEGLCVIGQVASGEGLWFLEEGDVEPRRFSGRKGWIHGQG